MLFQRRHVRELEEKLAKAEQRYEKLLDQLGLHFFVRLEQRVEDLEVDIGKRRRVAGRVVKSEELPSSQEDRGRVGMRDERGEGGGLVFKLKLERPGMTTLEQVDLAYWERNMLALHFAEGWYNDDVAIEYPSRMHNEIRTEIMPRFPGWRRVLSLEGGKLTFHVPDDFDVGDLPEIAPKWDAHTTEEKWRRVMARRGIREVNT